MRAPAFAAYRSRLRQALDVNWSPGLVTAVVAALVLVVPGVAVGATTAQPGERMWDVKRGLERARLALTWAADDKVEVHVDIAARRIAELNQVLNTGRADPQVVDEVIDSLRGHTEAATVRLNDVGRPDRAALVTHLADVVDQQVAVLDVLSGACAEGTDQQCVALAGAEEASVALQRATTAIALAEDVLTDEGAGASVGATDMAVSSRDAAASEDATAAATPAESSESPTETQSRGAGAAASEAPTDSASLPATDGSGSAATTASPAPPNPSTGQPSASDGAAESSSPTTGPNTQETADRPATTGAPPSVDLPVQPKGKGATPP